MPQETNTPYAYFREAAPYYHHHASFVYAFESREIKFLVIDTG